jgi:hypothetical protein
VAVSTATAVAAPPLPSDRAALEAAVLAEVGDTLPLVEIDLVEDRIGLRKPLQFVKNSAKPVDATLFGEIVTQLATAINVCNRARLATGHHAFHFIVGGHADVPSSQALDANVIKTTEMRATKVRKALLAAGVAPHGEDEVLHARGYGGCAPIEPFAGRTGARRNMRVDIVSATRAEALAELAAPLAYRAPPEFGTIRDAPSNAVHCNATDVAAEGFEEAGRRRAERAAVEARAEAKGDGGELLADIGDSLFALHFGEGLVMGAEAAKEAVASRGHSRSESKEDLHVVEVEKKEKESGAVVLKPPMTPGLLSEVATVLTPSTVALATAALAEEAAARSSKSGSAPILVEPRSPQLTLG